MDISAFFIRVILLIIPGLIGARIVRQLRGPKRQREWEDFVSVMLMAAISYLLFAALAYIVNRSGLITYSPTFSLAFVDENTPLPWGEIAWVSVLAIPIGFGMSYLDNHKVINRLGRAIRASARFGDEDVWEFFHNSPEVQWVFVRDHKVGLIYFGHVEVYSDSDKRRELILSNVSVFRNEDGSALYNVPTLYVSREFDDLTIEVPEPARRTKSRRK